MNDINNLIINIAELLINREVVVNYKSKIICCAIVNDFVYKSFYLYNPSWTIRRFKIDSMIKILHGVYCDVRVRDTSRGLYITEKDFNELRNKVNSDELRQFNL